MDAFRRRTLAAGIVAGGLAIAGLFVLRVDAPRLFDDLAGPGLPFVAASVVAGSASLVLCVVADARWTRALAVVGGGDGRSRLGRRPVPAPPPARPDDRRGRRA